MFHRILIAFFALYGYVCLRFWQRVVRHLPHFHWLLYAFLCLMFLGIFMLSRFSLPLPHWISSTLAFVGGYWLAITFYLIMFTLTADILFLLNRAFHLLVLPQRFSVYVGGAMVALACLAVAIGTWNAYHPYIKRYDITVDAKQATDRSLNIVLVSDIHMGEFIGLQKISELVAEINALSPDLVLIAGDIFDNTTAPLGEEGDLAREFSKIQSRLGVYACLGNHDSYDGGHAIEAYLSNSPIHILADESVVLDDSVVLIGRKDANMKQRASMEALTKTTDNNLPTILLDHQPDSFAEEEQSGISLVLSGHTHRGQMFPFNIATMLTYDLHYGYGQLGGMQMIVTSGYGVWGTPVRIGSRSEIVQIQLNLQH